MEVLPPELDTGGKACKGCRFWVSYPGNVKSLLNLPHNGTEDWGKCCNQSVNIQAQIELETGKFTDKVVIQKVDERTLVSTYSSYHCPNYKKIKDR